MDTVERLQPAEREGYFEGRKLRWSDQLRAEGLTQGRAEGLAAGREEERRLLLDQVARKFGQAPARRLAAMLAGVDDPDRLREVGGWIIDCETGDDLVARVAGK